MKFFTLLSALASLGTVSALPNPIAEADLGTLEPMVKRDPSDKSGKSQFVMRCEGTTTPNFGGPNGELEGGTGRFSSDLLFNTNGEKIQPKNCEKKSTFCSKCTFEGGGLSSATDVTGCWNPAGGKKGCSVEFDYNGHHYDSQDGQDKCGHQNEFKPFESGLSAVCYFDV